MERFALATNSNSKLQTTNFKLIMKFIHLSDLHIGKRLNEFPLIDDQRDMLEKIVALVRANAPDAVFIAGDVYDKSVPSAEAVGLFDGFLYALSNLETEVFIISGNHDSPERLAFLNRLIDKSGVHISPVYSGAVKPFVLNDEFGAVNIYMLPFVKPQTVKKFFDEEMKDHTEAVTACIKQMKVDESQRNVLIAHQFVTGAERSDSEELSVGGLDNVDASVFAPFDYVALGHIHRPQTIGGDRIRYSGSPLKYSFSEANDEKGIYLIELKGKGELTAQKLAIKPLHEMKEIKGKYEDIISRSFYEDTTMQDDFLHITLTDEEDVLNAMSNLRVVYKNLMKLDYDNTRTRAGGSIDGAESVEEKSPYELFNELFVLQNGVEPNEEQQKILNDLIEKIWGGDDVTD